jgi:hypothetical protein
MRWLELAWIALIGCTAAPIVPRPIVRPRVERPAEPAPDRGPFCVIARSRDLSLHPLADRQILISSNGPAALCDSDGTCASIARDPLFARGRTTQAAGSWGRDMWITLHRRGREGSTGTTIHFDGVSWTEVDRIERGWRPIYIGMSAAPDGRIVGFASYEADGIRATARELERGAPRLYRIDTLSGSQNPTPPAIGADDTPFDVLALETGVTLLMSERDERMVVLRSPPGGARADRIVLPVPPGCGDEGSLDDSMDGPRDGLVFIGGARRCEGVERPYLVRIDRDQPELIAVGEGIAPITSLTVEPDGTAWIVAGGLIHARAPSGEWRTAPLPLDLRAQCVAASVQARDGGDVFAVVECTSSLSAIVRTRCPAPPLHLAVPPE